jgi:hypothetical protein
MGTFHHGRSPLHGITVVVGTRGPELYVGRCDDEDERQVVLLDADVHRAAPEGEPGGSAPERAAFLRRAAQVGVWGKLRRVVIPRSQVTELRPLGEIEV